MITLNSEKSKWSFKTISEGTNNKLKPITSKPEKFYEYAPGLTGVIECIKKLLDDVNQ